MSINEEKQATNLIVETENISAKELQNRLGAKHEVIRDVTPGKFLTVLAVETEAVVDGQNYETLENFLKDQFHVRAMQTVFAASVPTESEQDMQFNVHITGHLRIEPSV